MFHYGYRVVGVPAQNFEGDTSPCPIGLTPVSIIIIITIDFLYFQSDDFYFDIFGSHVVGEKEKDFCSLLCSC